VELIVIILTASCNENTRDYGLNSQDILESPLPLTDPRDAVLTPIVLYTYVDGHCDKLVTDNRHQFITLTVHLR